MEAVGFEDVEELGGVEVGTVVVGQGDDVGDNAVIDVCGVGDAAEEWSGVVDCRSAGGDGIGVACSVKVLTVGIRAVVGSGSTISLPSMSVV